MLLLVTTKISYLLPQSRDEWIVLWLNNKNLDDQLSNIIT